MNYRIPVSFVVYAESPEKALELLTRTLDPVAGPRVRSNCVIEEFGPVEEFSPPVTPPAPPLRAPEEDR